MRPRPVQDVRIWRIQHRPEWTRPWVVRWVVDGEFHSKSFRTKAEADRRRSRLLVAQQDGEWFDPRHGEPESWHPAAHQTPLHTWARQWVADEWETWAPRTRRSQLQALARFLPLVVDPKAPDPPPGLRAHLIDSLEPGTAIDDAADAEKWLSRWSLSLGELDESVLAEVERRLGLGDEGQQLAASTAGRHRKIAHACVRRAFELKKIPADPWPPSPRGRSKRKARRIRKAVDVRRLPDPVTMVAILAAMASHQSGSRTYQMMTAIGCYAGLRPSETVMLRPRALQLPPDGWGTISVTEADDGDDEPAEPKTGERTVPIGRELVEMLRSWIAEHQFGPDDLLFRTRTGRRPTPSNWNRTLKRACRKVGFRPLTPYDARHACATTWLGSGVPLGEAALRLGHTVETLVAYYVGALQGDDLVANQRIDAALSDVRTLADRIAMVLAACWLYPTLVVDDQ
ncbi:MAG: tyrosine-type recombinase/integrase [Acidimicrobiales bacterium]